MYNLFTTLCIDGFDLQILWDKSYQINPPHHINFLSVNGFNLLLERADLKQIEITTPGEFDVDIVKNAYKKIPKILSGQNFIKKLRLIRISNGCIQHIVFRL